MDMDNILKLVDVFVAIGAVPDDRYAVDIALHSRWTHNEPEVDFRFASA